MRILTVLTYYRPHTSGLTIYAERLVNALAARGHQVTVLTTQYDRSLPREETMAIQSTSSTQDGSIRIIRLPIIARISKGVLAPSFGRVSTRLVKENDVILLHLPQFDAAGVALRGRLAKKPTVILYHSDILLPKGLFNRIVNTVVMSMNYLAGWFAHRVVAYTEDFAKHSAFLSRFADKRVVILPNVQILQASPVEIATFKTQHNPSGCKVIGMATRFAAEKGIEILLAALPIVRQRYPDVKVLFAGQYQGVWGEEAYAARLMPLIKQYQVESCIKKEGDQRSAWEFLGILNMQQMAAFYPNLDVLVVPSLNSTETFGFVQIEAMMNGVPTVASNLAGVRQPVAMTGMGKVIPVGDASALADAILDILDHPAKYGSGASGKEQREKVIEMFRPDANAAAFEKLFKELMTMQPGFSAIETTENLPGMKRP